MLRQPDAGVEKRTFRLAGGDPRWVQPSAAVTLQARFTGSSHTRSRLAAHTTLRGAPQNRGNAFQARHRRDGSGGAKPHGLGRRRCGSGELRGDVPRASTETER